MRRILREEDLPRVNACNTTRLSIRWSDLTFICPSCSTLHLNVVNTARSSKTFICSLSPVHTHPATVRHCHKREGILARNLWCLTGTSVGLWSKRSSPLIVVKPANFCTKRALHWSRTVLWRRGGRSSKLWRWIDLPGVTLSTIS